mgnify:CR=1 FL=1
MIQQSVVPLLLMALLLASCGGEEPPPADDWPSEEDRRMRPEHAPTPFTAEQIRAACPAGRRSTFRIEMPGRTPFLQTFHFTAADAKGAEMTFTIRDEEGKVLGEPTTQRSDWSGLQAHASWPIEHTSITEAEEAVPAGTYRGFLYRVEQEDVITEAFFARELPGPPIRRVRSRDGKPEMTMTRVAHEIEE